ncbi:ribosome maturation factor RimP [Desertibaculum subflavum]|uniref:ribosome maturation factor RimP n=1 Tax=Desertibaculum subflavum TaxID=2268458 RepID=UPI000E66A2DA
MLAEGRLASLIEPTLDAMGFRLVRLRIGGGGRPVLQLMAERADGSMSIDDCTEVSRAVSAVLDVEDPIAGAYNLEVSSPGIDRPLVRTDDFARHQGFVVRIETRIPVDGRKRFKGKLGPVEGDKVRIDYETSDKVGGQAAIPIAEIAEAKLVLTDELIQAALKRSKGKNV